MGLLSRAYEIYSTEGIVSLIASSKQYLAWQYRRKLRAAHQSIYSRVKNYHYVDVMAADWDTLVILDGCRYDLFETKNTIPGRLEKRHSRGSSTPEFLQKNIVETYNDCVYVTANPQYVVQGIDGGFHTIVDVWDTDWDSELGTVPPQVVTKRALEAQRNYPNKRLLIHYMQPHYPFIGSKGQQLPQPNKFEIQRNEIKGEDKDHTTIDDTWTLLKRGEVSKSEVVDAYRENLELVFPHIKTLLKQIDGRTIVTSDHGNLYGERVFPFISKRYGHPTGIHAENLVTVPWLIIEGDSRREIESGTEDEVRDSTGNKQEVRERLRDLGYVDQ